MAGQRSIKSMLKPLASLRLTVALLAIAMVLIFAGTLAQAQEGIWEVTHRYFRSLWVWIDLGLFIPGRSTPLGFGFPCPGGYTLGALMFVNLLAAHISRFKFSFKRLGVILTHAGLIILIIGEFVTGLAADEGNMTIDEGASSNYVEDIREVELAFFESVDATHDRVVVVPQSRLTGHNHVVSDPRIPVEVHVAAWMPNSSLLRSGQLPPGIRQDDLRGIAMNAVAVSTPKVSGASSTGVNVPSAYVTVTQNGQSLGTWLVTVYVDMEQAIPIPDSDLRIALRFKRTYKPYTIELIDFSHDRFIGTERPRNFSSRVRLIDPTMNEDREVLIYMNHPLRHAGDTLYQASFKQDDSGTVLQVVRNPGWLIPYISCILVTIGLLYHFLYRLGTAGRRALR